jgi:site-specific DNA recombinase
MKVIAYLRLSKESEKENSLGIMAQQKVCEDYVKKMGLSLNNIYIDEGYSGALNYSRRPGLVNALSNLSNNDIFLIAKRDRIGRELKVILSIEDEVVRKGATLISAIDEGTYIDNSSNFLMRRMVDTFSEYERRIIQERIKAALAIKKARGEKLGGKHTPYGYKLAEDGIHLEIDEREQEICRILANLHASGVSFRKMPQVLEEMGITNRGIKWSKDTIHLKVAAYRRMHEICQ